MRAWLAAIAYIAVFGLAFYGVKVYLERPRTTAEAASFTAECKAQLTRQLRSPAQAQYGSIHDVAMPQSYARLLDHDGFRSDDRLTLWVASVDAPNAYGTMVRSYALCYRFSGDPITAVLTSDPSDLDFIIDPFVDALQKGAG